MLQRIRHAGDHVEEIGISNQEHAGYKTDPGEVEARGIVVLFLESII